MRVLQKNIIILHLMVDSTAAQRDVPIGEQRDEILRGIRTIHYLCREMGKQVPCLEKVQDRAQQCLLHVHGLPSPSAEVHIYDQLD